MGLCQSLPLPGAASSFFTFLLGPSIAHAPALVVSFGGISICHVRVPVISLLTLLTLRPVASFLESTLLSVLSMIYYTYLYTYQLDHTRHEALSRTTPETALNNPNPSSSSPKPAIIRLFPAYFQLTTNPKAITKPRPTSLSQVSLPLSLLFFFSETNKKASQP
ncbi:hypothetical protein V8C26DRAFT_411181 [Trichoderma gracile]